MSRPQVSVVIPHHGDAGPTLAPLGTLLRQEAVNLQLIVVDDASPTPFIAVPGVRVVRREANGGFGTAVNSGVACAEHPWLLVLNSDVAIDLRFVRDLVAAAEPWQPALVSPNVVDERGERAQVGRRFPTTRQQALEWLTPLARFRNTDRWHRGVGHVVGTGSGPSEVDWVVGAAMLLPTELFRRVGGFDERYFMNAEEVDLQRRLHANDVRSVALDRPVLMHSAGGSSDPGRRRSWLVASRLAYAEKWNGRWGRRRLQTALVAATGANLAVNAVRRAAGRDVAPLTVARTELDLIRSRPHSPRPAPPGASNSAG